MLQIPSGPSYPQIVLYIPRKSPLGLEYAPLFTGGKHKSEFLSTIWNYRTNLSTFPNTMVKPFAGSSGMDILNIAAPPRQPLHDGLIEAPTKDFI